jgi:hypothetical protein
MLHPSQANPAAIASNTPIAPTTPIATPIASKVLAPNVLAPKAPAASKKRAQQISTHYFFEPNHSAIWVSNKRFPVQSARIWMA